MKSGKAFSVIFILLLIVFPNVFINAILFGANLMTKLLELCI